MNQIESNKFVGNRFIIIIHKLIVFFMFFGFLLPKKYLWLHLLMYPIVRLHWFLNNNKCFLTELQFENVQGDDYPFMKQFFRDIGFNLSNQQLQYITDYGLLFCWLISFVRLFYFYIK
jgi:hypothetical protein